jgi:HNH endonuclease
MARRDWTREELILAFNLYCKTPFGKIHIRNPDVIALATAIGRTPSAVSWKLANFARLDPALQKREVSGAAHGARAEIDVWREFSEDWERLAYESERLLSKFLGRDLEAICETFEIPEGKTREVTVRARVNQGFFRSAVLAAYGLRCCITGLSIPQLLTASHIVPWSVDAENRTNPRNGLCLNSLHDRAFDCGLITVTTDLTVKISVRMTKSGNEAVRNFFLRYNHAPLIPPRRFAPDQKFLRYHNQHVFLG